MQCETVRVFRAVIMHTIQTNFPHHVHKYTILDINT